MRGTFVSYLWAFEFLWAGDGGWLLFWLSTPGGGAFGRYASSRGTQACVAVFILFFRRFIFTDWVGGGEDASGFLLSEVITFICMAAGRKGVRALPFYLRLRLLKYLGERGGGGVFSDCLPSVLVRSVCMPAGRESKRVPPVLIILPPFIFTDSVGGREKGCRWLSNLCGGTLTMYVVSGWIG